MDNLIKMLDYDKIKINWNKNPVEMDRFISFLTIETEISRNHLGSTNGWTKRYNEEHQLYIRGGILNGVNYLDGIEYGKKLQNPYNNYVNPFYLKDIMTQEGIDFFLEYYKDDIKDIMIKQTNIISSLKNKLNDARKKKSLLMDDHDEIKSLCK